MVRYIDLTLPIEEGMPVWPGDSGPEFREVKRSQVWPRTAQDLAERGIALLGMDTPSPSPVDDPEQGIHKTLLDAGIVLLECLTNLHRITGNERELIVLPPLFKGCSGSPCRAVAVQSD